jgi:tRNA A-37 threonylcarbamoyl transferase component Bud32
MATGASSGTPQFIGRYRLIERIGKGAMGMVYAADDDTMGRRVAVKVMMTDLEEEPDARERFYREARVTGQLLHRNIVTVYDLGEDHGRPYIVMELLHGMPLGEYLQRPDSRSLDARLDLMLQTCEGLQVAHERGIVHRDIKPNNLFVQHDGSLKILDFGSQDLPKVLNAVMFNPPAPFNDADAPDALAQVLLKALEKDPEKRYRSCTEMAAELEMVRRAQNSDRLRVSHAALDRYRRVLALVEERRALGRHMNVPNVDALCDESLARIAQRFPEFARHAPEGSLMEAMDPSLAAASLMALQKRYNTELAAVAALREQIADSLGRAAPGDIDLTLQRSTGGAGTASNDAARASLRERAAALFNKLRADRGQSTTAGLMFAGGLTGLIAMLLAAGALLGSMAATLRTIAR